MRKNGLMTGEEIRKPRHKYEVFDIKETTTVREVQLYYQSIRVYEKIEEVKANMAELRNQNHHLLKNVKGDFLDVSCLTPEKERPGTRVHQEGNGTQTGQPAARRRGLRRLQVHFLQVLGQQNQQVGQDAPGRYARTQATQGGNETLSRSARQQNCSVCRQVQGQPTQNGENTA